jgi:hypothetical protein
MKTNVRSYTDKQLLARVKTLKDFKYIPKGYWLLFVRSNEDEFDRFDDKAYLFKGLTFILVTSCTTNKGDHGTAVIKSDQWLYNGFIYGLHKGAMKCLRQNKPFHFYRDTNKDQRTEEIGKVLYANIQTQFHGATYHEGVPVVRDKIGLWSEGCIVANVNTDYEKIISTVKKQGVVTGCLIMEF